MKRTLLLSFCCAATLSTALAQQPKPKGYTIALPMKPAGSTGVILPLQAQVAPIPTWNYSANADASLGGATYTGTIMGRSPYNRGKTTTTVPTQIIPLVITINNGGTDSVTYDPTAVDACAPGHTDVDIITGSPIFTNNTWTMNGVNVGNTQYIDAFQRAEFWSLVQGTPYHLILNQSTLSSQALSFGSHTPTSGPGTNYNAAALFGGCGFVGVVNINDLDNAVQALINGPLSALVNAGTFPIFLTKNVVSATTGNSIFSNCCVLGYHSAFTNGANQLQVYSPFSLDTSGTFGGDVSTLSHEMGEAINDPYPTNTNNQTPVWGNQGQVSGCQGNFEVGDPLSPGGIAPTSNEFVVNQNGLTYHLQELAFYSWFYGGTSLGAGGKYSNNGTFGGFMKLCSNGGGTN